MVDLKQLLGLDEVNLCEVDGVSMHRDCVSHWRQLQQLGASAGFDIQIASGYRSFGQQLQIWNEKVQGLRPVLDEREKPVNVGALTEPQVVSSILRWSALPGASRHHWGSELDVYERSLLPGDYRLALTVAETRGSGILAPFYAWLDKQFKGGEFSGFCRPYFENRECYVADEPWHLSCIEVARRYEKALDKDRLLAFYRGCDELLLRDQVVRNFDEIYDRYIGIKN